MPRGRSTSRSSLGRRLYPSSSSRLDPPTGPWVCNREPDNVKGLEALPRPGPQKVMSRKHHHRRKKKRRSTPGSAPGSIDVAIEAAPTRILGLRYGAELPIEEVEPSVLEPPGLDPNGPVLWVQVVGLQDTSLLKALAATFGIHRLTLEDIVHTHQRPKVEFFEHYHFVTLRYPDGADTLALKQLSLVVGDGFMISFEEGPSTQLEPVIQRIRERAGIIHSQAVDYLAYACIDCAIDHFFPVVQSYSGRLEETERVVLTSASKQALQDLYLMKAELTECRRSVAPLRDLISTLLRNDHARFSTETRVYLRDCSDHVGQLMELIDSDRDEAAGLMDLYVSNTGNRMNEVMKLLTIISTIFIPLSFVAGLYGMNFDTRVSSLNMPELGWRWGYPAVLALMAALAGVMLLYFRRKGGWTGGLSTSDPDVPSTGDPGKPDRPSEATELLTAVGTTETIDCWPGRTRHSEWSRPRCRSGTRTTTC